MKQTDERGKHWDQVKRVFGLLLVTCVLAFPAPSAQASWDPSTNLEGFGFKIFKIESGLYPYVQIYLRTFDENMNPLVNLNYMNIGLMVKGLAMDPMKRQYMIQSIRGRSEAIRSILVLDTSITMRGAPFDASLRAAARFIDSKRAQDQVAIIALDDKGEGFTIVSNFERDPATLGRRLADLKAEGRKTRLYDGIGAALLMAGGAGAGGTTTSDASYVASTSIVIFSDGLDEGSALTRNDLMTRISNLDIPVPMYSLAYSNIDTKHLLNLQALSKNSAGKYFHIGKAFDQMTRSVEEIQNIMQNDYVITFRSYIPVDGEEHAVKIGVEYPAGSGKMRYNSDRFEAISMPRVEVVAAAQDQISRSLPLLPDNNPYVDGDLAPVNEVKKN
jgi:Mg-chelatase subunit ChlD